jgi:hypothetical protein
MDRFSRAVDSTNVDLANPSDVMLSPLMPPLFNRGDVTSRTDDGGVGDEVVCRALIVVSALPFMSGPKSEVASRNGEPRSGISTDGCSPMSLLPFLTDVLDARDRDREGVTIWSGSGVGERGVGTGDDVVRRVKFGDPEGLGEGELLRGREEVRGDTKIGTLNFSLSLLGVSVDMDRPSSTGSLSLVLDSLRAESVLLPSRKLSGGNPSSFAGSDCPMRSKIPVTSSEKDRVIGRRGDGRWRDGNLGGESSSSLL